VETTRTIRGVGRGEEGSAQLIELDVETVEARNSIPHNPVQPEEVSACGAVHGTAGVVVAGSGPEALTTLQGLLPAHRVWERFPASVA
jgi:hypothetical protein